MRVVSRQISRSACLLRPQARPNTIATRNVLGLGASYSSMQRESSEGKNVIVTGSSRGIGRSIALRLAADGYNVCVNDVGANAEGGAQVVCEIEALGRKACFAVADVTRRAEVVDMIQTCVKELGPLNTMYVHDHKRRR